MSSRIVAMPVRPLLLLRLLQALATVATQGNKSSWAAAVEGALRGDKPPEGSVSATSTSAAAAQQSQASSRRGTTASTTASAALRSIHRVTHSKVEFQCALLHEQLYTSHCRLSHCGFEWTHAMLCRMHKIIIMHDASCNHSLQH
jgi:hypothetical protein